MSPKLHKHNIDYSLIFFKPIFKFNKGVQRQTVFVVYNAGASYVSYVKIRVVNPAVTQPVGTSLIGIN